MRQALLGFASIGLIGCTAMSADTVPPVRSDGLGSDLRVFFNDQGCESARSQEPGVLTGGVTGLLTEIAVQAGGLVFKTIGRVLQEMGAPKMDRSTTLRGGFLFTNVDEKAEGERPARKGIAFNPQMTCVHIVRGSIASNGQGFRPGEDAELVQTWQNLGLTRTPTLYALVRLKPTAESQSFMRGELIKFIATDFERNDRRGQRDFVITMEFERPGATAYVGAGNDGFAYTDPTGPYARGVFKLTEVRENTLFTKAELAGAETGLMPMAPDGNALKDLGAFNLYVDVFEFKRGDPLLADFGTILRSQKVEAAADKVVRAVVDPEESARQQAVLDAALEGAERTLVRTLDQKMRDMELTLAAAAPTKADLQAKLDALDDAAYAVRTRQKTNRWVSEDPTARLGKADNLMSQARARLG